MSVPYPTIPFEKQSDPRTSRMCGAASLSMVYRSFGKEVPQAEIWTAISKPNRFGVVSSTTHLMAQDAINRGFAAVAIQARHPLQVLRLCREGGIRAILNHRVQTDSTAGHYSVLVDLDEKGVTLHDPFFGPSRSLTHEHLLELWLPRLPNSEIPGNTLLAISASPPQPSICEFCHTPTPVSLSCPRCMKPVGLHPREPLGCMNTGCIARMWNYICCPSCDFMWSTSLRPSEAENPATEPGARETPATDSNDAAAAKEKLSSDKMFEALDKFLALIAEVPGSKDNPEIVQQLAAIKINRERLTLANAEAQANQKQRADRMAGMRRQTEERQEIHRKKLEELQKRLPPLDGDALGHALLKNLGFMK